MAKTAPAAQAERTAERNRRRQAAERRFRAYGAVAVALALGFLALLLGSILTRGATAFVQTGIRLEVAFDPAVIGDNLADGDYGAVVKKALEARFPEVAERARKRQLYALVSGAAEDDVRRLVTGDPKLLGTTRPIWLLASPDVDQSVKGKVPRVPGAEGARLNDAQLGWLAALEEQGAVSYRFNTRLLTNGDSRDPEQAGVWGAVVGSFYTVLVTLLLSFPLGVATAVYIEEFAPRNRWTDLVEVNINNLAAVPSIVFGLLGLAVFLNLFGLPRSAPLVGGLVLTLMTLPTIIIAARASLKSVPPSIREAALGVGASKLQTVTDHVMPLALPGIMTGTILGMARALGETAPLLMIGMVAFIVDIPRGPLDPATTLPVQVYLWADSPERAFVERTSAAIIVLLLFLIAMNLAAIVLRKKFQRRW
ncbi:MAG: phosphate ABC transporter permease PstA [Solirubrobacterales bacterium]